MRSDWCQCALGDVITLKRGYDLPAKERRSGNVPIVSSSGFSDAHAEAKVKGPGVVTGRYGTIGSVFYVDQDFWPLNTTLYVQDFKGNDPRFVSYLLRTVDFYQFSDKAAVPGVNRNHLHGAAVWLPPLHEQRQIAATLTALDDRIDLLRQTNTTLEAIAQALFKSWFIAFDPVRALAEGREPEGMDAATATLFPAEFEESALGLIPRGWTVAPIRDVVEDVHDGPHATPPETNEGPVFLGIKNLTGTSLDFTEVRHIGEDHWAKWTRRVTPQAGDIVFSYEAALGLFALIPPDLRCCLGRRLALIRPKTEDGTPHFWFHQFVAWPFQQLLSKHTVHGATVNRIALKEFPSYPVLNPPSQVRTAFERIAAPLWAKIHSARQQALELAALRDTLLPRLISGKLRLPEAREHVAEALP